MVKYLPFDEEIIIALTDADGDPVDIEDLSDARVILLVNNKPVLRFKNEAEAADEEEGTPEWKAWTEGDNDGEIKCPVTRAESGEWNFGLFTIETRQIYEDEDSEDGFRWEEPEVKVIAELKKTSF